jgi:hypothetical protein
VYVMMRRPWPPSLSSQSDLESSGVTATTRVDFETSSARLSSTNVEAAALRGDSDKWTRSGVPRVKAQSKTAGPKRTE